MRIKKASLILLFSLAGFFALVKGNFWPAWFVLDSESTERNEASFLEHRASDQATADGHIKVDEELDLAPANPVPVPWEITSRRLLATFQVDDAELASAVIYTEGHGAYRYRVGGELPGGATLLAIEPASVLIEQDGHVFSLDMDILIASSFGPDEAVGEDSKESTPEYFSRFSEEAKKFIDQFDLSPVRENFPEGYIIGDKFTELGVDHLGVQPGDIVLSVNGYPVGEYESDYLVWLSFRSTQKASVVVRGEQGEFTIHYPEDVLIKQQVRVQ